MVIRSRLERVQEQGDQYVQDFRVGPFRRVGETVKVILARGAAPDISLPHDYQFCDPFTTVTCRGVTDFSGNLANRIRVRRQDRASYEFHRVGREVEVEGQGIMHECIVNCSSGFDTDLLELIPHGRTPNSLISRTMANHENIYRTARAHTHDCDEHHPLQCQDCRNHLRDLLIRDLPTAFRYPVIKLDIRVLGPPRFIGTAPNNLLSLEFDGEAHIRFSRPGSGEAIDLAFFGERRTIDVRQAGIFYVLQ